MFAVARREIGEKAFVLLAACVLAFVPFLATLIPGVRQYDAHQVIVTTAAFLSVGFALGLAVILGATVIGRDLSERRLSFYFARPISPASIWFGKMAASLAMVLVSFAVLFLPSIAVATRTWRKTWNVDLLWFMTTVALIAIALMFIAHALSTMIRSRSPFVLVDFVLFIITVAIGVALVLPLVFAFASQLAAFIGYGLAAAFIVALVGAGWYQLQEGRVERRQSHRALSLALWSSMGCALVVAAVFVAWVLSAKPGDLTNVAELEQARSGPWIMIGGHAAHRLDYQPRFFFNTETRESRRIAGSYALGLQAFFSMDGKTAGWIEATSPTARRFQIVLQRLDRSEARIETGIPVSAYSELAMTDDLSRIATFADVLSIWDVPHHKLLGSVRLQKEDVRRWTSYFIDADHLRLIAIIARERARGLEGPVDHAIRIFEYDVARRTLAQLGETHVTARNVGVTANADGTRLFFRTFGAKEGTTMRIIDARTAATLIPLDVPKTRYGTMFRILANGMITAGQQDDTSVTIRFFAPDGALRHELSLPNTKQLQTTGEVAPGKLLVTSIHNGAGSSTSMLLDSETGAIVARAESLYPSVRVWFGGFSADPRHRLVNPNAMFIDAHGSLVSWNPLTGARKVLVR
jgi:ABC-type transport system involved in multi-copper enzyme maturation permease subunit